MLPKELRLSSNQIISLSKNGKRLGYSSIIYGKFIPSTDLKYPQFAISVSKKIAHDATLRNRLKRKVRQALMDIQAMEIIPAYKYLIMPIDQKIAHIDNSLLVEHLLDIFPKK